MPTKGEHRSDRQLCPWWDAGMATGMAKLTPTQRAKLPARKFGLPEKARTREARKETGNYPMPDHGHAVSAKRLARMNRKDGNLTKEEFDRIERKADKVIDEDG
jgi:hypothetical protein